MKKLIFGIAALLLIISYACNEDIIDVNDPLAPTITSLTADKDTIVTGPGDPATITCVATGDSLGYLWDVDLGDITVISGTDGSQILFTAADCCEGVREIKCKVYNDHGEDNGSVKLQIKVIYP